MLEAKMVPTKQYKHAYRGLTPQMRKRVDTKIGYLSANPAHPSLKPHRMVQAKEEGIWGCYISTTRRLLYQIKGGIIYLLDVGGHSIVDHVHLRRFNKK